jgi:hypothetical membrane protein
VTRTQSARLAGLASVVTLAFAVAVAVALDPTAHHLPVRARLSDLGRPGAPGAFPFGYGLLVAGLLGLAFARERWRDAVGPLDRAATALAGAAFLGLAVAGLSPEPSVAHAPFLAMAYLAGWTAPLLDAIRLRKTAAPGRSRAAIALVAAGAFVAVLWAVRAAVQAATFLLSGATSALLLAELATLGFFAGWVLFRAWGGTALARDASAADLSAGGR